jgi:hypothetical protein
MRQINLVDEAKQLIDDQNGNHHGRSSNNLYKDLQERVKDGSWNQQQQSCKIR